MYSGKYAEVGESIGDPEESGGFPCIFSGFEKRSSGYGKNMVKMCHLPRITESRESRTFSGTFPCTGWKGPRGKLSNQLIVFK